MSADISKIISDYSLLVEKSDRLARADIKPTLLGLLGELGSVLTASKKIAREKSAYRSFRTDAVEELGDTLWYVVALAHRLGVTAEEILCAPTMSASGDLHGGKDKNTSLLLLMSSASKLTVANPSQKLISDLKEFSAQLLETMNLLEMSLEEVISINSKKVAGRFLPIDFSKLPNFDKDYDQDERLPDQFEFVIKQRKSGKTHISLNDVFIGDPLTDNIGQSDGYRFHDVFHMANAAVLHWSPVLRSLLKRKRKSDLEVDGSEDSGRAIVVEEGLSAWVFSRAKQHDMFENTDTISFDILKRISEFVDGYEVQHCPHALWERAIILGFSAFRSLQAQKSGVIIGDRLSRTIYFRSLS